MVDWLWILKNRVLHLDSLNYEPAVKQCLTSFNGGTFWDVGANIGYYSLMLRKRFKTVIAIEPDVRAVEQMQRRFRFRHATNIKIYPYALSDHHGVTDFWIKDVPRAKLFRNSKSACNSLMEMHPDGNHKNLRSVRIETTTFDDVNPVRDADLVKVDTEGAELLILKGMQQNLAEKRVKHILVECHKPEYQAQLEAGFKDADYEFLWIDRDDIIPHILAWPA